MLATFRRSLTAAAASSSRLLPTAAQSSLRPLSSTPATALHESLPLDPLPSSSSTPATVLTAASEPPDEDSTPLSSGLSVAPESSSSLPSSSSPTPWPTAETLLGSSSAPSTSRAVDLLNSQPRKYILTALYQQKYVLHERDVLTVPQLKPFVKPGTRLSLTRIFEVGSHDYQLRATKGSRLTGISCEATVLEHTTSPMSIKRLKKRRKGYKKEIRSKMRYTRLRIGEIVVGGTGMAADLEAPERKLDRPVSLPFDQYNVTDNTIRGRLARQYGISDFGQHRQQ